jgi:hypothetical protein
MPEAYDFDATIPQLTSSQLQRLAPAVQQQFPAADPSSPVLTAVKRVKFQFPEEHRWILMWICPAFANSYCIIIHSTPCASKTSRVAITNISDSAPEAVLTSRILFANLETGFEYYISP